MNFTPYGTTLQADEYFENRLHSGAWDEAADEDRGKAIWAATQAIDALNFKGMKHTVYELGDSYTDEELRAAELAQPREFPRGADTVVPDAILAATYEIAYELLDGRDPQRELENLEVTSEGYSSVRASYNRNQVPHEHLICGIVSVAAWRHIRPFLRDDMMVRLHRAS